MGKSQRDKGAAFELSVAKVMGARKVSAMYKSGTDLDWHGYGIECKKLGTGHKTLYGYFDQHEDTQIVVLAVDYKPKLIVMPLDTFLDIIEEGDSP